MMSDFSNVPGVNQFVANKDNYTGFMSLPIGDLDFMTQTQIQGTPVHNPYTQYNWQFPSSNYFQDATFIDANGPGRPVLQYIGFNPYIIGHIVVPVPKPDHRQKHYNVLDSNGNLQTPTYLSSTDLWNQPTFVPKGVSYNIFGGISQHDKIGFLVLPIGSEFYNWRLYVNVLANPDWNKSQIVYD